MKRSRGQALLRSSVTAFRYRKANRYYHGHFQANRRSTGRRGLLLLQSPLGLGIGAPLLVFPPGDGGRIFNSAASSSALP